MKIGEVLTGVVGEEEILRVAARGLIKVGHPRPANESDDAATRQFR